MADKHIPACRRSMTFRSPAAMQSEFPLHDVSFCSRLQGDVLCRCGSNFKGRYCIWSYCQLPPGTAAFFRGEENT